MSPFRVAGVVAAMVLIFLGVSFGAQRWVEVALSAPGPARIALMLVAGMCGAGMGWWCWRVAACCGEQEDVHRPEDR